MDHLRFMSNDGNKKPSIKSQSTQLRVLATSFAYTLFLAHSIKHCHFFTETVNVYCPATGIRQIFNRHLLLMSIKKKDSFTFNRCTWNAGKVNQKPEAFHKHIFSRQTQSKYTKFTQKKGFESIRLINSKKETTTTTKKKFINLKCRRENYFQMNVVFFFYHIAVKCSEINLRIWKSKKQIR